MARDHYVTTPKQAPYLGGLHSAMEGAVMDKLRFARTTFPATVIKVDSEKSLVTVSANIRFRFDQTSDEEFHIKEIKDIPILFSSAKRGEARMTFPVQEGDVGLVHCSDRHTENFLASDGVSIVDSGHFSTMGIDGYLNVIGFVPEIFTGAANKGFDPNDVVLTYGNAETRHKQDGTIISTSSAGTSTISPSGEISLVNGAGHIKLLADGSVDINGFIIKPTGAATSPVSVGAPTMSASSSLTVKGKEMDGHEHSAGTYKAGDDKVTGDSGEPI